MNMTKPAIIATLLALASSTAWAQDFSLPLSISSGVAKTAAVIGIEATATNGFDKGLDVPSPFTEESLNAYFNHPEWNITSAGSPVTGFYRDIRGTLPQTFSMTVATTLSPVIVTWDKRAIPQGITATLGYDDQIIDMRTERSFTFSPMTATTQLTLQLAPGDTTPPAVPAGLSFEVKGSSLYLSWTANTEEDLAGYKVKLVNDQGEVTRSLDVKNVTNYSLMNVGNDIPYRVAVTAYDTSGNQSALSPTVTAVLATQTPAPAPTPTPTPTPTPQPQPTPVPAPVPAPVAGDLNGDGVVNNADQLIEQQQILKEKRKAQFNVRKSKKTRKEM